MADIGVLSLQIHSESTQAENSLRRLEGALLAIRNAVNGNGLSKTVSALQRLRSAVDVNMITNLNGLAVAMKKIQDACNFTVPSMAGLRNVQRAMEGVSNSSASIREAQTAVRGISDGFGTIGESVDKAVDHIKPFVESLNKPIDYSNLSKFVDGMVGIGRETRITQQEVNVFATDAAKQVGNLISYLEKPVSYKGLGDVVNYMTGVSRHFVSTADDYKELASLIDNGSSFAGLSQTADAMGRIVSETESAKAVANDYTHAVSQEEYAQKALNAQNEIAEHEMQRIVAIAKTWSSMSSEKQNLVLDLYKDNPDMREAIEQQVAFMETAKTAGESATVAAKSIDSYNKEISEAGNVPSGKLVNTEELNEGLTMLDLLKEKLTILRDEFSDKLMHGKLDEKGINRYEISMLKLEEQIERLQMKYDSLKEDSGLIVKSDEALKIAESFMTASNQTEIMRHRIEELKIALGTGIKTGTMDTKQLIVAANEIKRLQKNLESAKDSASGLASAWNDVKTGASRLFSPLTKLGKQFLNIAKRMMIRAIIRQFISGIKEGIENVYNYSKAVGTDFAPAMDQAATALQQMKNSLGAMVAPLLQALIPVLQSVVNWLIQGLNYLNQFIALLNGQKSWTRALPATTTAFNKQEKAAKGAAAAVKDLLADWDELNIIQSETSGSGNTGTTKNAEDVLKMFEEVNTFDKNVESSLSFIKENMQQVKDIATDAGIAILGWKVSKAFEKTLGKLGAVIGVGAVIKLSFDTTGLFTEGYIKSNDATQLLVDGILTGVFAYVAKKMGDVAWGKAGGLLSASLTVAVSAGATFAAATAQAKDDAQRETLNLAGAIKAAVATALAAYGFHALGIKSLIGSLGAGAVAVGLAIWISYQIRMKAIEQETADQFAKKAFAEVGEGGIDVSKYTEALQEEFTSLTGTAELTLETYVQVPDLKGKLSSAVNEIKRFNSVVFSGSGKLTEAQATEFKNNWGIVIETLKTMNTTTFDTILEGVEEALQSKNEEIRKQAAELRVSTIMIEKQVDEATARMLKDMEDAAAKAANGDKDALEKYKQFYYSDIFGTDSQNLEQINLELKAGKRIDFGDETTAVENAKNFIKTVGDAAEEAMKKEDESLEAVRDSVEWQKKLLKTELDNGYITKEQYDNYVMVLEADLEIKTKVTGDIQDEISKAYQEAYDTVFAQVSEAYKKKEGVDADRYWESVVEPLLDEATKHGYGIPQELMEINYKRMMAYVLEKLGDKISNKSILTEGYNFFARILGGEELNNDFQLADLLSGKIFGRDITDVGVDIVEAVMETKEKIDFINDNYDKLGGAIVQATENQYGEGSLQTTLAKGSYALGKIAGLGEEDWLKQIVIGVVQDAVLSGPEAPAKEEVDQALQQYNDYKQWATNAFEELTSGYDAETENKFYDWLEQNYDKENNKYPDLEEIYKWAINHRPYGVGEDVGNELQHTLDMMNWYRDEYLRLVKLYEQEYGEYHYEEPSTSGKLYDSRYHIAGMNQEMYYGRGYTPYGEESTEADMASATEKGTKAANSELEDNTSETNRLLRQLLAKNWQINLFPTSGWGLFNNKAAEAAEAVTGYNP